METQACTICITIAYHSNTPLKLSYQVWREKAKRIEGNQEEGQVLISNKGKAKEVCACSLLSHKGEESSTSSTLAHIPLFCKSLQSLIFLKMWI